MNCQCNKNIYPMDQKLREDIKLMHAKEKRTKKVMDRKTKLTYQSFGKEYARYVPPHKSPENLKHPESE